MELRQLSYPEYVITIVNGQQVARMSDLRKYCKLCHHGTGGVIK